MTGRELIRWIQEHEAEDLNVYTEDDWFLTDVSEPMIMKNETLNNHFYIPHDLKLPEGRSVVL
jgi:hypothetical protein